MNPNDIVGQMLAATTAQRNTLATANEGLAGQAGALAQNSAEIQALGAQYVDQAATAAKQQAGAEYARAVVGQQAQAAMGLNPDDVNNEVAKSLATISIAQPAREAAMQEWNQLQQVDFMSNPIGYVLNQFKANDAARRYNAAEAAEADAYNNIQKRTTALNQVKNSVAANTADAVLSASFNEADAKATLATMDLKKAEADSISKQAGIWMQQVDLQFKSQGLIKDAIKFRQDQQNFAEARQERAENRALRAEQFAEIRANKNLKLEAEAEQRKRLAALSDFVGRGGQLTPETLKQIKDSKLTNSIITAADTLTMGDSLADGVAFVAQIGDGNRIKQTNPGMYQFLVGSATSLKSRKDQIAGKVDPKTGKAPKETEAARQAGDTYQDELERSVGSPKATKPVNHPLWDTEFNAYKAPYEALLDADVLPNNLVTKAAKALLGTKPEGKLLGADETTIFKSIAEQVKAGALRPDVAAAQIKEFYDTAARAGVNLYQYDRFGLPVPKDYYVNISVPGKGFNPLLGKATSEPAAVNLRSVASVERALAQYAVATTPQAALSEAFGTVATPLANFLRGYELPSK